MLLNAWSQLFYIKRQLTTLFSHPITGAAFNDANQWYRVVKQLAIGVAADRTAVYVVEELTVIRCCTCWAALNLVNGSVGLHWTIKKTAGFSRHQILQHAVVDQVNPTVATHVQRYSCRINIILHNEDSIEVQTDCQCGTVRLLMLAVDCHHEAWEYRSLGASFSNVRTFSHESPVVRATCSQQLS
jgi:hypothetical protein